MIKKRTILLLTLISTTLLTGCVDYLKFEITRYLFGFFFTLIIGVILFIIMGLKGSGKNDRK